MEFVNGPLVTVVIWFVGLIFAAGGAWMLLKESAKHVNGIGAKLAMMEQERNDRHTRTCMALMALAGSPEAKNAVLQCLNSTDNKG